MDHSTAEEWAEIGRQTTEHQPRVAEAVLAMLRALESITDGFGADQLLHCRQTATMAERAGADDEVVVAALCHDVGKAISVPNHAAIAAEMLKPYVRPDVYNMIRVHQDFQGRYYYQHFGKPQNLRDQHRDEPWYSLTETFTDQWDQAAFDPAYDTLPLEHFESRLRAVFAEPRY
jgi:predicted HD phosphohydrolase